MSRNNNISHNTVNVKNRKATFDYEIVETFTAGIVLTGTDATERLFEHRFAGFVLPWQRTMDYGHRG
ncbi:MAG: SsrA-binding protein [Lachnospiraceae bacterium]|nr:SsrA-binding protein [Lachnospiraceae bacterium]